MDEQKLRDKFEEAIKVHNDGTGQLFLYSLLDFDIQYDEQKETVSITVPVSEIMFNPIGFIHGGLITYIADTAMGHLCAAFADSPCVSLELKTQFLNTAREGQVHAKASFLKKGRSVQFAECVLEDNKGKMLAKVSGTFYSINK